MCGTCYRRWWRETNRDKEREHQREYQRARYQSDPNVRRKASRRNLYYNYGITPEEYDAIEAAQFGRCAACGIKSDRLQVDHCHDTGKIRGLLCGNCNSALGHAKDDVDRLMALVAYLTV